uniref:Uncharacterized protein n=1 Tax=Cucumis sativus TaxID=3659 RepID=A0A0A0LD48_CUCSA
MAAKTVKEPPSIASSLYKKPSKPPFSVSNFTPIFFIHRLINVSSRIFSSSILHYDADFRYRRRRDVRQNRHKVRSLSFKPARSVSIRRFLAALSDLPPGGELSPSTKVSTPSSARLDRSDDGGRL